MEHFESRSSTVCEADRLQSEEKFRFSTSQSPGSLNCAWILPILVLEIICEVLKLICERARTQLKLHIRASAVKLQVRIGDKCIWIPSILCMNLVEEKELYKLWKFQICTMNLGEAGGLQSQKFSFSKLWSSGSLNCIWILEIWSVIHEEIDELYKLWKFHICTIN